MNRIVLSMWLLVVVFGFSVTANAGNLYVSSFGSSEVLRYDGNTGAFIDIFASLSNLNSPSGLVFLPMTVVPEPTSLTLLGIGAATIFGYGWRRRRTLAA